IDLIDQWSWLSDKVKKIIHMIFFDMFGILLGFYIMFYSIQYFQTQFGFGQVTTVLQWSMYIIVIPFVVGGVLTIFYFTHRTLSLFSYFFGPKISNDKEDSVK